MRKRKVLNLIVIPLIVLACFRFCYWYGDRNGYAKGRIEENKAMLSFRMYMYLQLYDMRKQIDSPESPLPENLIAPINTMFMVSSGVLFYEKYQHEYDQGQWTSDPLALKHQIERGKKIREKLQEALIQQNVDATNSVMDQAIQQSMEPATNSSSRAVEAETID